MELKRGRLIDHLHLHSANLVESKRFYQAVLGTFGIEVVDGGDHFYADELWIDAGKPATRVHFAFQARDRDAVQRFYNAGLEAGARIMARQGSATTIRDIMQPSYWIQTAIMLRRCTTALQKNRPSLSGSASKTLPSSAPLLCGPRPSLASGRDDVGTHLCGNAEIEKRRGNPCRNLRGRCSSLFCPNCGWNGPMAS